MSSFPRPPRVRESTLLAGWLFADLLLGLAVIFLAANTYAKVPPPATPTPTRLAVTPSPTVLPRLELHHHRFTVTVDANGLLTNDAGAVAAFKRQVRAQSFLVGRTAGLVIVYDGAPTVDAIGTSLDVSRKVMSLLAQMGSQEHFAFTCTSFYDPLYTLGQDQSTVTVDVYLFTEHLQTCPPALF
ncbi:hypothetical protein [Thermogemmatispora tikiterensis]|uniref:Uncharacterized protein n=1 Tax=Thermogemmatispora tikiterensis TaxID=1825093 RepID=A0A328VPP8_9CHLR|nr:hypothetical protein [Thermogemmatispora tikiterensis]RAQ97663.1 hypothetical protein A4R35_19145 [Thermogemmatispora tikiterensis]